MRRVVLYLVNFCLPMLAFHFVFAVLTLRPVPIVYGIVVGYFHALLLSYQRWAARHDEKGAPLP